MGPAAEHEARQRSLGALSALAAYTLWGLLPVYWKALMGYPLWETLAHRAFWSLITIGLLLAAMRRFKTFVAVLRDPARLRLLGVSSVFIASNWTLYVLAIEKNQVVQASLGYYVNPLVSVGMGVFFLREKLNRIQIAAVALAGAGVLLMAWEHRGLPWIALGLAGTFSVYGLMKKKLVVEPLAGLGVETLWMLPPALAYLAWLYAGRGSHAFATGPLPTVLLIGTGAITLAPLFFFNAAARRLPLSTLGFFQYLSPTIQLVLAVALFHEPFGRRHALAFGCIWAALAIYSWDAWRRLGRSQRP